MKNKKNHFARGLRTGASIIILSLVASFALAQSPASDEDVSTIGEVIVTVERKSQSLQDFPGTAGVLNAEQLKELNLKNIHNLDGVLPGVNIKLPPLACIGRWVFPSPDFLATARPIKYQPHH
jgi:iron complex outermembrane receptor protein